LSLFEVVILHYRLNTALKKNPAECEKEERFAVHADRGNRVVSARVKA
jgi:hypothetical protein